MVPKSVMLSRLAAMRAQINEIKTAHSEAISEIATLKPAAVERDTLRTELSDLRTTAERDSAFASAGITDPAARKRFEIIYKADVDGLDEPPAISDWLAGDAREDPFLAAHFPAAPGDGAPAPAPPAAVPAPRAAMPPASRGAEPPNPSTAPNPGALREAFHAKMKAGDRDGAREIRNQMAELARGAHG